MKELSRKERDQKRKRYDITRAALSVFAQGGYHGATMAQISKVSEYPLGTIYKFFSGKEQIYHDLVLEKGRQLGKILWEIFENKQLSPLERLKDSLWANAKFCSDNVDFIKIYISERSSIDAPLLPKMTENINKMHQDLVDIYSDLFDEGINSGDFKPFPKREMARLFTDMLHSVAWFWINENEPENALEERITTSFRIFTEGACS